MGLRIASAATLDDLRRNPDFTPVTLGDIQPARIKAIVESFGLPFEFRAVAVCAQDHGAAPAGISHLEFRHQLFKARLDQAPYPHTLIFSRENLPAEFSRLRSIARAAAQLPTRSVYVMDSGMAAILGASLDPALIRLETFMVLDIATSHTVGAAMEDGMLCGFFEYHTTDITAACLDLLLKDLADGKLSHRQILDQGGHGAYIRRSFGYDGVELILATGPRRRLAMESKLPITFGAPWGDNMMTGTVGLMEAVRRREEMPPIRYL
jgi:uncharacterized protein (DUF1786 family)